MKRMFASFIFLPLSLLSFASAAGDVEPRKKTYETESAQEQVFVSKSDILSGQSSLSSFVVETVIKSLPTDIPTSAAEQANDSVADRPD